MPGDGEKEDEPNTQQAGVSVGEGVQSATRELREEVEALRAEIEALRSSADTADKKQPVADLATFARSDEVESLRTNFAAEVRQLRSSIEQLAAAETSATQMDASQAAVLPRLERLEQSMKRLESVAGTFDEFVQKELPRIRRKTEGLEDPAVRTSFRAQKTEAEAPRSEQRRGKLIIDNDTDRVVTISVNGKSEQLRRGRNTFAVAIGNVEVVGEGRRWLLDASLWQTHQGEQILYRRSWPP